VRPAHRLLAILLPAPLALLPPSCRSKPSGPKRIMAMEMVLNRQIEGLRELVDRAEKGTLLPKDKLVVSVHEDLVKDVAQLALPREQIVDDKYRILVEKIDVRFRDRWGSVRMDGRVGLAGDKKEEVYADVAIFGFLDAVEVDAETGTLKGLVRPIGIELQKLEVFGSRLGVRQMIESLALQHTDKLKKATFPLTIPVRLENRIQINGTTEGPVRLKSAEFPLQVTVADVIALDKKLWVFLDVEAGPWRKLPPEPAATAAGGRP